MERFQIIINKPSIKDKLFIFWNLKEVITIFITSGLVYFITKNFLGEVEGMLSAITTAILIGGMFIDLPNGLNVLDHIKLFINHYKKSIDFYYIPNIKGEKYYVCEKKK